MLVVRKSAEICSTSRLLSEYMMYARKLLVQYRKFEAAGGEAALYACIVTLLSRWLL